MSQPLAYYNEIDPKAAAWLRELIAQGHIAPGEVDERDIRDVRADDLTRFRQCHFFAGIGVWSYAARRAGWPDARPLWSASLPCQPWSEAGKGQGFADDRHLWPVFDALRQALRPVVAVGEQVASKNGLAWLDAVQADVEATGDAFGAVDLCAAGVGAPHPRQRLYWMAYPHRAGCDRFTECDQFTSGELPASFRNHPDGRRGSFWAGAIEMEGANDSRRVLEPGIEPLAHGAAARVGRLRGYGNAINAEVATAFIEAVMDILDTEALAA